MNTKLQRLHLRIGFLSGLLAFLSACDELALRQAAPGAPPVLTAAASIPPARLGAANAALEAGDYAGAKRAYSDALQAQPTHLEARVGLAESFIALQDHASALALLDSSNSAEDQELVSRIAQARGILDLRAGRARVARSSFKEALNKDPSLWRSWIGLGRANLLLRKEVDARVAFSEAERHAPANASSHNDVGMSYLTAGDARAAITHFERALAIDPANRRARVNLRIARALEGDYDKAVRGSSPQDLADALSNAGFAAITRGDFDAADQMLRRALAVSPTHHATASANLDLLASVRNGDVANDPRETLSAIGENEVQLADSLRAFPAGER